MHKHIYYFFFIFLLIACNSKNTSIADYKTVPIPQSVKLLSDENSFVLTPSTQIIYPTGNEILKQEAEFLSQYIQQITGHTLITTSNLLNDNAIILNADYEDNNPEGYQIKINQKTISINGSSEAGTFYGIQTLRKSIPLNATNKIQFPAVEITDYPAYKHRGVSLDVSRHFFPTDFIKKYIDVLALCNMNVFHWHLTDDQGWRIEVKKYPKLTEIGSKREKTIIGRHTDSYTEIPHGGYYTQEEIKDIVQYATQRHITVIPEIDIPGHTLAVLASYPNLGCTGGPYQVGWGWGIYEDVLCAGNEEVFAFLTNVFDEVTDLFPAQYIHIGGDECLKNRWMDCPKCQSRMTKLGIKESAEHSKGEQLQSYFIKRVEKIVNAKGKRIIGWDEILEGGIAPNATIMSWRGTEGGIYAANKGHDVIMTPEAYVYLDYYQSPDVDNEPFTYGWLTELEKVYSFNPMPVQLEKDKRQHILGAQANVWAEYMPTSKNVEYMLLPRMCALAETVWSNPEKKNYKEFVTRLEKLSGLLDKLGYENCKYAFIPEEKQPQRYPVVHKAVNKPITLLQQPDARYTFQGGETLVNGQLGPKSSYRTGGWIGFLGTDIEAIIDLEEPTEIKSFSVNTYVNTRGNLIDPESITLYTSSDKNNFKEVATSSYPKREEHINPTIIQRDIQLEKSIESRYIKVYIKSPITLPDWHEKKGDKAYLMIDEICIL